MNIKNLTFLTVILILAVHFWVRFKVGEPYPGFVLPSFSSHGGNSDYYKFSKVDYTFYSVDNDSLTVLPKAVFIELHKRFAGHYTSFLWDRKHNGKGFTLKEEKELMTYLFDRGEELWNFKKTISHIIVRKNQFTYAKGNPSKAIKKTTLKEWQINRSQ